MRRAGDYIRFDLFQNSPWLCKAIDIEMNEDQEEIVYGDVKRAECHLKCDLESAIYFGREVLTLANRSLKNIKEEVYNWAMGYLLCNLGRLLYENGEFTETLEILNKAIIFTSLSQQIELSAHAHNTIGQIACFNENYEEAADHLKLALEMRMKSISNSNYVKWKSYNNLGLVYAYFNQTEKAERLLKKSFIERSKLAKFPTEIATSCANLGLLEFKKGNEKASLIYYNQSLAYYEQEYGTNHVHYG